MKRITLLLALLSIVVFNTQFQCEEECITEEVGVRAKTEVHAHLDNRGPTPVIISTDSAGWREAYGFRLSAINELNNPADTIGIECPYYFLNPRITSLSIVTLTGTGAAYPSGADVSELFKYVVKESGQYKNVSEARFDLLSPWALTIPTFYDFLLVHPPSEPSWQQFEIFIQQSDSTAFSIVTDSIYLQ